MSLAIRRAARTEQPGAGKKYALFAYPEVEQAWTYEKRAIPAIRVRIAPTGSPLASGRRRLAGFLALQGDWDSYGARTVSEAAVQKAGQILNLIEARSRSFVPVSSAPFAVVPVPDGGVQLEWRRSDGWALELEVGPKGEISYLIDRRLSAPRFLEEQDSTAFEAAEIIESFLRDRLL